MSPVFSVLKCLNLTKPPKLHEDQTDERGQKLFIQFPE